MNESTDHDAGGPEQIDEAPSSVARAWVVRLASGRMTAEEMSRFKNWLAESRAHQAAFDRERTFWQRLDQLKGHSVEWGGESPRVASERRTRLRPAYRTIVAGGAIVASIACIVLYQEIRLFLLADYRTAAGEQRVVTLPDGGIVRLNTDTAIAVTYREHERRIDLLRGEAFFEVMPDRQKPFRVLTPGGVTQAIGTAFVVQAQEQQTRVTVVEGVVDVSAIDSDGRQASPSVAVRKDQQTFYYSGGLPQAVADSDGYAVTAWTRGAIVIQGQPFAQAMAELDRYRPGRIVILADASRTKAVSGRFTLTGIDDALTALAATQGFRAIRVTNYLVVIL